MRQHSMEVAGTGCDAGLFRVQRTTFPHTVVNLDKLLHLSMHQIFQLDRRDNNPCEKVSLNTHTRYFL